MINLDPFEIDFVETNGKLTWAKSRGHEFYIREGQWYRRVQNMHDPFDIKGCEYPLNNVRVFDNGDRLEFEDNGVIMLWVNDGHTSIELSSGGRREFAPEDVQQRWGNY